MQQLFGLNTFCENWLRFAALWKTAKQLDLCHCRNDLSFPQSCLHSLNPFTQIAAYLGRPSQIICSLRKQTRPIDSSSQQVEEPCSMPVSKIVSIYRGEGLNRLCETCRLMSDLGRWRVLDSIGEQGDPHTKGQTETWWVLFCKQTHTHTHTQVREDFENPWCECCL